VASNAKPPAPAPDVKPTDMTADMMALQASLNAKGVDMDLARRAMSAYRKSIALPDMVLNSQVAAATS